MSNCDDWVANELGPLQIDYLHFYSCDCKDYQILAAWILIIWVIYLINIVGSTASNYFSPTLSSICEKFDVRYDIAGVTFLAFGNGAPDVFSSITSFSGAADVSIGIGALLGGSVFVSSIVVGSIALICPTKVTPKFFIRDIVFHMLAVSTLSFVNILGYVNIMIGIALFFIYFIYVVIVLTSSPSETTINDDSGTENRSKSGIVISGIQTAFWHQAPSTRRKNRKFYKLSQLDDMESYDNQTFDSVSSVAGYKFLTVSDNMESGSAVNSNNNDEITIDLFGGFNASEFEGNIVEDYFPAASDSSRSESHPSTTIRSSEISQPPYRFEEDSSTFIQPLEVESSASSTLRTSLLPEGYDENVDMSLSTKDRALNRSSSRYNDMRRGSTQYGNALAMFYWKHEAIRNRFRKSIFSSHEEWLELSLYRRVMIILEFPAAFARDITIPTLDANLWNKYYAVAQPVASALFLNFLVGYSDSNFSGSQLPMPVFWLFMAIPFSMAVYLLTHYTKPPQDVITTTIWNIFAFIMSIAWIYTLSKELVVCLSCMGKIFHISPGFLGLTVLAWGNSLGDLISNTAIARQGLGEMALAGCYGGPVFNILVGLGLSFTYACWKSYPNQFKISLDSSSVLSLIFLYISLGSTLSIVIWRGYKLEKTTGIFLISLYILYTICQIMLLALST